MNSHLINETASNGFDQQFVAVISLISISFGISIIVSKNPIVSVLYLIGLFFSVSIYLMLLGLYFIALAYLLVYVGAVSILFLFILMLISVRVSELLTEGKNSIPLAINAVLCFNFAVNPTIPDSVNAFDALASYMQNIKLYFYDLMLIMLNANQKILAFEKTISLEITNVNSKGWDSFLSENNHMTTIGNVLYTDLFILLIITSLILLLAMVGCIVITVRKKVNYS